MCLRKAHCLFMYNGETESTLTRTLKIENEILGRGGGFPFMFVHFETNNGQRVVYLSLKAVSCQGL